MPQNEGMDATFRARLRAELRNQVGADSSARMRPQRVRRLAVAGAGVLSLAAVLIVGALASQNALRVPAPVVNATVLCADGLIASDATSMTEGIEITVASGPGFEEQVLSACAQLWQEGALALDVEFQIHGSEPENTGEEAASGGALASPKSMPVPSLVICASRDGRPVVVPNVDCDVAGLELWR